MITNFLQKSFNKILTSRAQEIVSRISPLLKEKESILDVGAGSCHIAKELMDQGYEVLPLDITNTSFFKEIPITVYDGSNFPFESQKFDSAIIITVLHHTKNPETIIREALHVCQNLVIIEDVIKNKVHKLITSIWDSLLNLEFFNHPHSNKSDLEWRQIFENLGLEIISTQKKWSFLFMYQITYHLRKKNAACDSDNT